MKQTINNQKQQDWSKNTAIKSNGLTYYEMAVVDNLIKKANRNQKFYFFKQLRL